MNSGISVADRTKYLITLVHGTFAKGAPWTLGGSSLRNALLKGLGSDTNIQNFEWSGKNTHKARLSAGKDLASFLERTGASHPDSRHVVIAHSHGGNVALYARKQTSARVSLAHIVCLATPFLRCQWRRRLPVFTHVAWLIVCLYFAGLVLNVAATAAAFLFPAAIRDKPSKLQAVALGIAAIAGFVGAFALLYCLVRRHLANRSKKLAEALAWGEGDGLNVLTVAYTRDEARTYLTLLDRLTAKTSRRIWQGLGLLLVPVAIYVAISIYLLAYHPQIFSGPFFSTDALVAGDTPLAAYVVGFYLILLLLAGLGSYLLPLMRGNPYGYGWERPSTTLLLDIDATDRPEELKAATAEHYRIALGEFGKGKGLAHSLVYEDQRVHDKIVEWIVHSCAPTEAR